jgi:choline dehydrogenase-like flavoprotein
MKSENIKHNIFPLNECDLKRRSKNGKKEENYDIIIVGSGPGGSLLTFRLAERYPEAKILLLETGKDDVQDNKPDNLRKPSEGPNPNKVDPNNLNETDDWGQLIRSGLAVVGEGCYSWQQSLRSTITDQTISNQRIIALPRGATLGGTSALNAMIWNRGSKQGTYDKWAIALGENSKDRDSEFGWKKMNKSLKTLENRSQETGFYGIYQKYWVKAKNPPLENPGAFFNPKYHGNKGNIFLTQALREGYATRAVEKVVSEGITPNRILRINLDPEDPHNPSEYHSIRPVTQYDQSDPNFSNINPYPKTTPGYTFRGKGPEYAGNPLKITNNIPSYKFLQARCFANSAYLYPIIYKKIKHRVTIKTNCYVTKLIFDNPSDPFECTGVKYVENGWHVANVARAIQRDVKPWKGTASEVDRDLCSLEQAVKNQKNVSYKRAYAKADVWICAGALDSPAILQRSGIGSKKDLENLYYSPVKSRVDLEGVGKNVQDTIQMLFFYKHEIDNNTYLPASSGIPFSLQGFLWSGYFGYPETPDGNIASISGASVRSGFDGCRLRLKTNPSKTNYDIDTSFLDTYGSGVVGNVLWQDIINNGSSSNITMKNPLTNLCNYDRSLTGEYDGNGNAENLIENVVFNEYWAVQSQGEVKITSGNVFDRPNYAPNILANENDLEALENHVMNNLIPICTKMSNKRFGPRGTFTYSSNIVKVFSQTLFQLASTPSPFKPYDSSYIISQEEYDIPNSSKMINAILTIREQKSKIIEWSGKTGNILTSYIAKVKDLNIIPNVSDIYTMSLANEFPYESVEYFDDNHRNFVRFTNPNGDELFSDLFVNILEENPFTTTLNSTKIIINYQNHNLEVYEMIKISSVLTDVNNIPKEEFNNYHVVSKIIDKDYFEIILFWNKTARPGNQPPQRFPFENPAINTFNGKGGGKGCKLHIIKFDKVKFRKWLHNNYTSVWHACCSCRMGLPEDTEAVVDKRSRVYDVKGLRICDASILPTKPDGNTQAPTYGITQRIFELVSEEEYDTFFKHF